MSSENTETDVFEKEEKPCFPSPIQQSTGELTFVLCCGEVEYRHIINSMRSLIAKVGMGKNAVIRL